MTGLPLTILEARVLIEDYRMQVERDRMNEYMDLNGRDFNEIGAGRDEMQVLTSILRRHRAFRAFTPADVRDSAPVPAPVPDNTNGEEAWQRVGLEYALLLRDIGRATGTDEENAAIVLSTLSHLGWHWERDEPPAVPSSTEQTGDKQ